MYRLLSLVCILFLLSGCTARGPGGDRITGSTGSGGTSGTGTASPTGTVSGSAPGEAVPAEGESTMDPDDSAITAAATAKLKEAGLDKSIQVDTDDGIVTLKGTAASQEQIEQIIQMVRSIPNVESVTSEIEVK